MPNVMVLTFTRALTEFVKTGCYEADKEIFPRSLVSTLESWQRDLYEQHAEALPDRALPFEKWKAALAEGAAELASRGEVPQYDALFIDEAQDLMPEEIASLSAWSPVLFFVGDDRQKIYDHGIGLKSLRELIGDKLSEHSLPFHYRLAPELCHVADRILTPTGGGNLAVTSQYVGPKPGHVDAHGPLSRDAQIELLKTALKDQLRVYGDLLDAGDRLGIVVPYRNDRELVLTSLERDHDLSGLGHIVRARTGEAEDRDYDPAIGEDKRILILTEKGVKGLECRALHWLFADELRHRTSETYYTVVTRAKTSLDVYHSNDLPGILARSIAPDTGQDLW